MKKSKTIKGMPLRESLKIRHYIMNLIYQHPNESIMIPPSKALAEMFGVARSTVTLVLKTLIAEGYLEGKRAIGTFTKHDNFVPLQGKMQPLIGLLAGDGKYFYYPHQVWTVMANCGEELTRNAYNVRPLSLSGATDDELFTEISHQYLDGLAWFDISSRRGGLIQRLKDSGLKSVIQITSNAEDDFPAIDSFYFDLFETGVELGKELIAERRSHLFFIFENPMTHNLLAGIRHAYSRSDLKLTVNTFDWATPDIFVHVESLLKQHRPDAIYVHGEHFATMQKILHRNAVDVHSACRLIAEAHAVHTAFDGWRLEFPFARLGRRMAVSLMERFTAPTTPAQQFRLPVEILKT